MESYGDLLRNKREAKKIDILVASRDTNITKEYIEALEREDASSFPGEAYLVGFLRNYAEYLDIPSETVLSLYHNKELQESAIPDDLIEKYRPKFLIPAIVSASVVVFAALVVVVWLFVLKPLAEKRQNAVLEEGDKSKHYELGENALNARVYKGDQITVPTENGGIVLTVKETLNRLVMETPIGPIYTSLSEEREVDIDGDTKSDIIIYLDEISNTDASRGASVRLLQKKGGSATITTNIGEIETLSPNGAHAPNVLWDDNRAYPFTVTATFRGACIFRYRSDNDKSEEHSMLNGETINITSNNRLRMWIANSFNVSFAVQADTHRIDLGVGRAGQVLVQDIKWIKTKEGRYQLVTLELD